MENGEKEGGRVQGSEEGERLYILINPPTPTLEVTYILTPGVLLRRTSTPMRKNKTWWLTPATQYLECRRKAYSDQSGLQSETLS